MINWKEFYANGGYNGTCDPASYDDGTEEEYYELDESELEEYDEKSV